MLAMLIRKLETVSGGTTHRLKRANMWLCGSFKRTQLHAEDTQKAMEEL